MTIPTGPYRAMPSMVQDGEVATWKVRDAAGDQVALMALPLKADPAVVHLLAAAWEMREALRGLLEPFDPVTEDFIGELTVEAVRAARAALKAAGDTP